MNGDTTDFLREIWNAQQKEMKTIIEKHRENTSVDSLKKNVPVRSKPEKQHLNVSETNQPTKDDLVKSTRTTLPSDALKGHAQTSAGSEADRRRSEDEPKAKGRPPPKQDSNTFQKLVQNPAKRPSPPATAQEKVAKFLDLQGGNLSVAKVPNLVQLMGKTTSPAFWNEYLRLLEAADPEVHKEFCSWKSDGEFKSGLYWCANILESIHPRADQASRALNMRFLAVLATFSTSLEQQRENSIVDVLKSIAINFRGELLGRKAELVLDKWRPVIRPMAGAGSLPSNLFGKTTKRKREEGKKEDALLDDRFKGRSKGDKGKDIKGRMEIKGKEKAKGKGVANGKLSFPSEFDELPFRKKGDDHDPLSILPDYNSQLETLESTHSFVERSKKQSITWAEDIADCIFFRQTDTCLDIRSRVRSQENHFVQSEREQPQDSNFSRLRAREHEMEKLKNERAKEMKETVLWVPPKDAKGFALRVVNHYPPCGPEVVYVNPAEIPESPLEALQDMPSGSTLEFFFLPPGEDAVIGPAKQPGEQEKIRRAFESAMGNLGGELRSVIQQTSELLWYFMQDLSNVKILSDLKSMADLEKLLSDLRDRRSHKPGEM